MNEKNSSHLLIKVSESQLACIQILSKEIGGFKATRSWLGFRSDYQFDYDSLNEESVKEVALRNFLELPTSHGCKFLLERAWLKAFSHFMPGVTFVFPHIDPFVSDKTE